LFDLVVSKSDLNAILYRNAFAIYSFS